MGDLSELLTRRSKTEIENSLNFDEELNSGDDCIQNNIENIPSVKVKKRNVYYKDRLYTGPSLESLLNSALLGDASLINAATQTSPSVSPTSTNLTWASECSSSPCLTSISDNDLIDEDSQSLSSVDGREQLSPQWGCEQAIPITVGSTPGCLSVKVNDNWPVRKAEQLWRQMRNHKIAEIEAAEACKWLRATGFPQYAQMYEDMQFPVDVSTVAQDHPLLEPDVLHSLFRRLQILNSCAHLHQQRITHANTDESEDECCALSDNWTYQTDIRRWSRMCKSQLSNTDYSKNSEQETQEKEDVFEQCTESPSEKLKRAGSMKFRRRRDGVFISDSKSKLLDSLTQQLGNLNSCEVNHISDSECTPKHSRRSRTKSFDTTDSWITTQISNDRILWHELPQEKKLSPEKTVNFDNGGPPIFSLSCTQLQVLRKLALLKLTAHMEKYCPSHRTGWNWDLPKFIRKIKTPIYRDKSVFGVPLAVTLQRTGQLIPRNIEEALLWLQQNAADQVGIFRKSGVPKEFVNQCKASEFKETKAVKLSELGKNMGGWREYLNECQCQLLKEAKDRGRGWVIVSGHNPKIEISYKKVADGHPLRLWKVSAEIEAPPSEVLRRIIRERHIWDPELHSAKIVSQIEKNCEIFQYVRRKVAPIPNEEFCVIRTWKTDLPKDACLIIETSVDHQDAVAIPNTIRGIVLASRYLIEPCGSGRSKLLHLSRVDSM
ncbi:START domain containing protein [Asbolus verrucosus]|uniref:START domain containing protein n=1 Tax=Asbolus verrucosus TaxID=1661398 RepID=A0A482VHK9_ASBVE|nr:START domain containing protein [Asbolus verrucosus]